VDKYKKVPTWRIGSALRKPLSDFEKFEHFNHLDKEPYIDRSTLLYKQTRWTKVKGGAIGHDPRVRRYNLILG
jgi:hypothetical protein